MDFKDFFNDQKSASESVQEAGTLPSTHISGLEVKFSPLLVHNWTPEQGESPQTPEHPQDNVLGKLI